MEEGYIKFNCNWIKASPAAETKISEINFWRDILHHLDFIGAYSDGVGYGNISIRFKNQAFLITGSATGGLQKLDKNHYVLVNDYDIMKNRLTCIGPIKASSESLSHAIIYECSPETNAVIHIHHLKLWQDLMNKVPTTRDNVLYGTPEMANEIKRLFKEENLDKEKIMVMDGHREGIITFGKTLKEAGGILLGKYGT